MTAAAQRFRPVSSRRGMGRMRRSRPPNRESGAAGAPRKVSKERFHLTDSSGNEKNDLQPTVGSDGNSVPESDREASPREGGTHRDVAPPEGTDQDRALQQDSAILQRRAAIWRVLASGTDPDDSVQGTDPDEFHHEEEVENPFAHLAGSSTQGSRGAGAHTSGDQDAPTMGSAAGAVVPADQLFRGYDGYRFPRRDEEVRLRFFSVLFRFLWSCEDMIQQRSAFKHSLRNFKNITGRRRIIWKRARITLALVSVVFEAKGSRRGGGLVFEAQGPRRRRGLFPADQRIWRETLHGERRRSILLGRL